MALSKALLILLSASFAVGLKHLGDDFRSKKATEKQNILWENIIENAYTPDNLPRDPPSTLETLAMFDPTYTYLPKAFNRATDEMEAGRKKLLHPFGTVAKIEFIPYKSRYTTKYTGIFGTGAIGFARLSWAKFTAEKVMPGVALKFLIDWQRSQNFHLMKDLVGQGTDQNFFRGKKTNAYPEPTDLKVVAIMSSFFLPSINKLGYRNDENSRPESVNVLGLYEQASVNSDGSGVNENNIVAPYKIELAPTYDVKELYEKRLYTGEDFRTVLATIPSNTVLYKVVAWKDKTNLKGSGEEIGEIVIRSQFVASKYGDENLYFQHATKRWQGDTPAPPAPESSRPWYRPFF